MTPRQEALLKLIEYHKAKFLSLGLKEPLFVARLAYKPKGKDEKFISLFQNDVARREDIYIEFTDRDLNPEDSQRTLWVWRFNPHFSEEYEAITDDPTNVRYLIPVSELLPVRVKTEQDIDLEIINPEDDAPIAEMSIRDLAAILLKKPVSRKEWLNKIITQ